MTKITFILLAVICLTVSCKTSKKVVTDPEDLKNVKVGPDDLVFKLKKGGCFGTCPVYEFRIYDNKYAEFVGIKHVEKMGTWGKFISEASFDKLKKAFDDGQFTSLEDLYKSNIADMATIRISYHTKDMKKTVTGSRERPEVVHKIQFQMEQIAETDAGWVKLSDETGQAKEPTVDRTQIIVDIARGNELARWFDEMKNKFSMQILKRLSNNSDSWLVTYDTKDHKPDEVLKYLQSDPVVKSASFKVESPDQK